MPGGRYQRFWDMFNESSWSFIAIVFALTVLVWLIIRVRTWFQEDEDTDAANDQMLMQLGDLHHQGDLSDEEVRSIKRQLVEPPEGGSRKPGQGN